MARISTSRKLATCAPKLPQASMLLRLMLPIFIFCVAMFATTNGFSQAGEISSEVAPVAPVDSNSGLVDAVNKMDRVLKGEAPPRDLLRDRLVVVALLGGAFLALLGVLFGYLRLEHASRGFYSGRLQIGSIMASIIILVVCYLLWAQVLFK